MMALVWKARPAHMSLGVSKRMKRFGGCALRRVVKSTARAIAATTRALTVMPAVFLRHGIALNEREVDMDGSAPVIDPRIFHVRD